MYRALERFDWNPYCYRRQTDALETEVLLLSVGRLATLKLCTRTFKTIGSDCPGVTEMKAFGLIDDLLGVVVQMKACCGLLTLRRPIWHALLSIAAAVLFGIQVRENAAPPALALTLVIPRISWPCRL